MKIKRPIGFTKEWYSNNRSYALNYKRMYRVDNIEKVKEIERQNHLKHKQKRNEYCLSYYYLNRDKILAQMRENYKRKKESKNEKSIQKD